MEGEQVQTVEYNKEHDLATKRLADLMQEYLKIKKVEREVDIAELHPDIRKRIYALKKIQLATIQLDADFHRAVYDLEHKFQPQHDGLFKKRMDIVNGKYEPADDECLMPSTELAISAPTEGQETALGIPKFWLTVIKNVQELANMIQADDEAVLLHLVDIRSTTNPSPDLSFQLDFEFEPNPFFTNAVLTKKYLMKCAPDAEDPFSFEGPEIFKSVGCEINWNEDMNVIEKSTKKDPRTPFFNSQSFFNFFNPPEMKDESEDNDLIESYLENDFEIGHYLKERVIPRAVLFFTNEIDEDMSDDDSLELVDDNYDGEVEADPATDDNH